MSPKKKKKSILQKDLQLISICPLVNLKPNMLSDIIPLKDGKKRKRSEQCTCQEEKDSLPKMTSNTSSESKKKKTKQNKKEESVTPEFLLNINDPILTDKLSSLNSNTPNTKSSQTSDPVSTGTGKVLKPFWTTFTDEESKKWWLPTKTGCADLDLNSWNGYVKNLTAKSWFTTKILQNNQITPSQPIRNWQKTSLPSLLSSRQEIMDSDPLKTNEEEQKNQQWKVHKIRLLPTKKQDQILKNWMGTVRWTYNQCLAVWNQKQVIQNNEPVTVKMNKKFFRSWCLNSDAEIVKNNPWLSETPYDIRDEGMNDFIKAFSSSVALQKTGKIKQFQMKFRSKKDDNASMAVLKKHWKNNTWFKTFLGKVPIKSTQPLPKTLNADSRVQRTRNGKYYLCLIKPLEIRSENQGPAPRTLILDPGVRTFMTGYDPSGFIYEWGAKDMNRIVRLHLTADELQSKWSNMSHNKRYRMKRAWRRIHQKIKDLINDMHRKCIKWMVENFTQILLPLFKPSQMVVRGKTRRLRKTTVRQMLTWSHSRFRELLISKVREFEWCKVILCDESYTSKTCGQCGMLHHKLGGNKTFHCPHCGLNSDRDHNAARNIWLKWLSETSGKV